MNQLAPRSRPLARALATVAILSATTALAGCGRSASPAEVESLSEQYSASKGPLGIPVTDKQSECRAKVLLEADFSDEARAELLKTGEVTAASKHDSEVLRDLADELADCL